MMTLTSRAPLRSPAVALAIVVLASGCAIDDPVGSFEPAFASCPGPGCGAVVTDQVSPFDPDPFRNTLAIGGQSDQVLAQVVTPGLSGQLTAIELPAGCTADGGLIVSFYNVVGDRPGTTLLGSTSIDAADLGIVVSPALGFQRIPLGRPIRITAGTPFSFVLTTTGTSCGILQALGDDPYGGGSGFDNGTPNVGGWRNLSMFAANSDDHPFRTIVRVLPFGG